MACEYLHSKGLQLNEEILFEVSLNGDVLTHALPPSGFDHELAGQFLVLGRLERPQLDGLVEWIARNDLPVVECREAEGLALCVIPEIHFEAKAFYDGQVGLHNECGCARLWRV